MRDKTADFRKGQTADFENGTKSPILIMRKNCRR